MEQAGIPLIGEKFPSLEVVTTQGTLTLPDAFSGKWFVLFSHPADFTPVCTTEFHGFQVKKDEFSKLNCELIGLSVDQVFSHIKWLEWIQEKLGVEITFPVIADDTGKVSQKLGLIHPGKGTNTVRAVFVVDPDSVIRAILYYPQELGRNIDEILRMVKGFQVSDANDVAIPANWPENALVGSKVIIPPATDVDSAGKRLQEYEGYDWWFCYKDLS